MPKQAAKWFVRIIGTLATLLGLAAIFHSTLQIPQLLAEDPIDRVLLFFMATGLFISIYLIWLGYLTWFRFSPLAVQHCCGTLGFFALGVFASWQMGADEPFDGLLYLGLLAIVFVVYRFLSRYLNMLLFPTSVAMETGNT